MQTAPLPLPLFLSSSPSPYCSKDMRLLHITQLIINLLIQEDPPLARQLRLQSLLRQSAELLLRHVVQIRFPQTLLHDLNDDSIAGTLHHVLEIDGAARP